MKRGGTGAQPYTGLVRVLRRATYRMSVLDLEHEALQLNP